MVSWLAVFTKSIHICFVFTDKAFIRRDIIDFIIRCEDTRDFSHERNRTGIQRRLTSVFSFFWWFRSPLLLSVYSATAQYPPEYRLTRTFPIGRDFFAVVMTRVPLQWQPDASISCPWYTRISWGWILYLVVRIARLPFDSFVPKDGGPHRRCSVGFEHIRHFPVLSGMFNRMPQGPGLVEHPGVPNFPHSV